MFVKNVSTRLITVNAGQGVSTRLIPLESAEIKFSKSEAGNNSAKDFVQAAIERGELVEVAQPKVEKAEKPASK